MKFIRTIIDFWIIFKGYTKIQIFILFLIKLSVEFSTYNSTV